jgi:hypothetical protein
LMWVSRRRLPARMSFDARRVALCD